MTRRPPTPARSRGFTLVEVVVVIVIVGVIGAIVAVFIRAPILGYRDAVDRAEITDQADLALRRMARDIRLALPNSVRVKTTADGDHLELLQTRNGGRYLGADDDGASAARVLDFDDATDTAFAVVAPPATFTAAGTPQVRVGDYMVVYNLGPGQGVAETDAYNFNANYGTLGDDKLCPSTRATAGGNIARICGVGAEETDTTLGVKVRQITLAANPFAKQEIKMPSPMHRFQVVSGPVSFFCTAAGDGTWTLWRAWGYPIAATQAVPTAGQRAAVASRLTTCDNLFSYDSSYSLQRSGLVVMAISIRGRNADSGAVRLVNQVHVDNTP